VALEASVILISLSALAITLAGFATIFRAFTTKLAADGHSHLRLIGIIESGIAITFFCYLPLIIQFFDISENTVFSLMGLAGALYYLRLNVFLFMARKIEHKTPIIYAASFLCALLVVLLFLATALSLFEPVQALYLLAIFMMFVGQGLAFIGQFWAESQ